MYTYFLCIQYIQFCKKSSPNFTAIFFSTFTLMYIHFDVEFKQFELKQICLVAFERSLGALSSGHRFFYDLIIKRFKKVEIKRLNFLHIFCVM